MFCRPVTCEKYNFGQYRFTHNQVQQVESLERSFLDEPRSVSKNADLALIQS